MANYNNKGGTGRFSGNSGGSKFSGNNSRKLFLGNNGRSDNRGGDRPVSMHRATCGECGNSCEVPFRPNGEKPVYCKDCFGNRGGNVGSNRFPRKDFKTFASVRPQSDAGGNSSAVLKQLETVNIKLERLIQAVGALAPNKPTATTEGLKNVLADVLAPVSKKSSKRKSAKK